MASYAQEIYLHVGTKPTPTSKLIGWRFISYLYDPVRFMFPPCGDFLISRIFSVNDRVLFVFRLDHLGPFEAKKVRFCMLM